jgi:hypothetical protein
MEISKSSVKVSNMRHPGKSENS